MRKGKDKRQKQACSKRLGHIFLAHFNQKLAELTLARKHQGMPHSVNLIRSYELIEPAMRYARSQFATIEEARQAEKEADTIVKKRMQPLMKIS